MTEQKSRLVIEISTENAKRNAELLNQEIQKLTEKGDKASASSSALGKELKTTSESAKTLGDSTSKATKELTQQESQLNKNGTAVAQLAKYVAGYLTISKAISMADGYTQMAARIKNATANAQEYALVQERLYQTANTTYRSLAEAQEVYLSMSGGMKSLGYSTAQTLDMTDSLSFAFTANATRADQAQSAMDALSKSMAKGKVDADAWISIVTGADNIIADMAKTTGKSEAAIRQLGATGKISLEDLIKTLIQTKDANEALANNMENSFADGMQKLFNATQKFLGELNKSTGATSNLAAGLGFLADHVDKVAIVGGVMASVYSGRVVAAWALSARSAIASAVATASATTAMNTAAISARALYAALGGPVGLGIAVTGVAASYLLMRDNGDKANAMLNKQSQYAGMAADELTRLSGAQKKAAIDELSTEVDIQNNKLKAAKNAFEEVVESILDANKANQQAYRIWAEVRTGVTDVDSAYKKLNSSDFVTNAQINQLTEAKKKVEAQENATRKANEELLQVKPSSEKARQGLTSLSSGAKEATAEITKLDEKLAKFNTKKLDALYISQNAKGWGGDIEKAKALLEFRKELGLGPTGRSLNADEQARFKEYWKAIQDLSKYEEKITKEKRDQTKESEKQLQTLKLSAQVQANAVKYNFSGLESKYGLPNGMLSALHAIETGNTGKTNQVNKTTGATGGFQFLEGTAKQYGVKDRTNLAQSAEGAAKYMAYLLKLFKGDLEKAVRAYHAGEGNVQKGTNIGKYNNDYIAKYVGYTAGQSGITGDFKDVESYLKEQYQLQLKTQQEIDQLKEQYSDADVVRSKKRTSEITEAEKLGQQALIPQINARYDAQDEIARLQLESELNMHKWTEEQKLQNTHDINVQRLNAEGQYSEQQKALVKKALDEQLSYELNQYKRNQQWKLLELRQSIESQQREANKIIQEFQLKQQFGMGSNYQQALLGLSSAETDRQTTISYESDINSYRKQLEDKQLTEDEFHQIAIEREQAYLDQKLANQLQYDQNVKELVQSQRDIQMSIWQDLLTRTGTVFSQMAEMVKNTSGESSAAYKAMFLTNQGISMAQAMINTEVAATKAMAEGGMVAGVPMATAIRALGYASVGMIAAQTIAGFSEGGYTGSGGKYEPAGVVHKGEVVFSQADIARLGGVGVVEALRKGQRGYSDGGVVGSPKMIKMGEIKQQAPQITINNNANADVQTRQNSDGSVDIDLIERQIANRLGNANSVISKSMKQNTTASRRR